MYSDGPTSNEITGLLNRWKAGDRQAPANLAELAYDDLRAITIGSLRRGCAGHTGHRTGERIVSSRQVPQGSVHRPPALFADEIYLVGMRRVELLWGRPRWNLNPVRLPVPPHPRAAQIELIEVIIATGVERACSRRMLCCPHLNRFGDSRRFRNGLSVEAHTLDVEFDSLGD